MSNLKTFVICRMEHRVIREKGKSRLLSSVAVKGSLCEFGLSSENPRNVRLDPMSNVFAPPLGQNLVLPQKRQFKTLDQVVLRVRAYLSKKRDYRRVLLGRMMALQQLP